MVVALLTDFGTKDGFVGAMKGVILSINPNVQIVDVSHEVEPFNILEGALLLKAHHRFFPKGTVFVCVVDPGVGSERRPLAVSCGGYFFVGPDNGIFDLALKDLGSEPKAVVIENSKFTLPEISRTFHGRDVFAPVAAHITRGVPVEELGRRVKYEQKLSLPETVREGKVVRGRIIHFDRFGNAITNVPCGNYSHGKVRGEEVKVVPFFQAGEKGKLNLICGSFGFMEIFTPMGSAKDTFGLKLGEEVVLLEA